MPARPPANADDIEFSSVSNALKRRAKRIILASVLVGGVTFFLLSLVAPRFQSEAELAIMARGASGIDDRSGAPDLITTRMDKEAINTHVRALQSPELIERLADELKLAGRAEFNKAVGPVDTIDNVLRMVGIGGPRAGESERDRVLNAFRDRLEVYSAKESRFIGVRFTSLDPELGATIANRLAERYQETLAAQSISIIDEQQALLQAKIEKLVPEVAALETEVDRYRGEINVFRGGAQNTGLNEQQMSDLTAELTRARTARGEAEARARSAREMLKAGAAETLPDVQKSPLIQNLVQQRVRIERQIAELSATLLPAHPRMRQLNADLSGLKRQISSEIDKVVGSVEKEVRVAKGREDAIARSLQDLKAQVVNNAPEEAKLRQLEANAKAKRTELENLQSQVEANRKKLDARAQPVEAKLISRAQASSVPVFPKKTAMAALLAVATALLGIAIVVTRALFAAARGGRIEAGHPAPAQRSEPELTGNLARGMGAAPAALPARKVARTATQKCSTVKDIAELIASRRSGSIASRTIVSGEATGTDAAGEAVALAKALAQGGAHVVLVEFDRGSRRRAAPGAAPGLNDLLAGAAGFEDVVGLLPASTVHSIGPGSPVPGAIDADNLNLVLDALDEAYDHVVVTGGHGEARHLFEAILGRFDVGVVVGEAPDARNQAKGERASFLGFEVADMAVVRLARAGGSAPAERGPAAAQRILATLQKSSAMQSA